MVAWLNLPQMVTLASVPKEPSPEEVARHTQQIRQEKIERARSPKLKRRRIQPARIAAQLV